MPAIRIGFGSDFSLVNQLVGVGTTAADFKLEVTNTLKGDFNVTGFTTLTKYGGFVSQRQNISLASTVGFTTTGIGTVGITSFISVNEVETGFVSLVGEFNTLAEDLIIDEGKIFDVSTIRNIGITTLGTQSVYVPNGSTVCVGKLESVSIGTHFSVPNGGIAARTEEPVEGMVRFNNDLNTLEFYNGVEWRQFTVTGASGRGVFSGGDTPGSIDFANIDFINIITQGNAINFGTLTVARGFVGACASPTRGLFGGGLSRNPATTNRNVIDYITIASEGNAINFGTLSTIRRGVTACSSSTRGIFAGGHTTPTHSNVIDYVQIDTLGTALDFGDLTVNRAQSSSSSSPTRGIFAGGYNPLSQRIIDFITISSTGNAITFGNLTDLTHGSSSCSNSTRGLFGSGININGPSLLNVISYVTISSTGDAQDFGDLTVNREKTGAASNSIRGVFGGGRTPSDLNVIDFVTISSIGNAIDFGDLTLARNGVSACSDSHGGLGGF